MLQIYMFDIILDETHLFNWGEQIQLSENTTLCCFIPSQFILYIKCIHYTINIQKYEERYYHKQGQNRYLKLLSLN